MPQTVHTEKHFTSGKVVRDIVIGMSDGLTVPFALAAGLSGAAISSFIVVTAGLAEIAAGAIAMGLGGYLAAKSDSEHYESERSREEMEVKTVPEIESKEVIDIFESYEITPHESDSLVKALQKNPKAWIDFMMRFELGLEMPEPKRARNSALTIGLSYIGGGLIPLFPYMIFGTPSTALNVSVGITLFTLFVFGFVKGKFTGAKPLRSALQTTLIGGVAAAAAFLIARAIA